MRAAAAPPLTRQVRGRLHGRGRQFPAQATDHPLLAQGFAARVSCSKSRLAAQTLQEVQGGRPAAGVAAYMNDMDAILQSKWGLIAACRSQSSACCRSSAASVEDLLKGDALLVALRFRAAALLHKCGACMIAGLVTLPRSLASKVMELVAGGRSFVQAFVSLGWEVWRRCGGRG